MTEKHRTVSKVVDRPAEINPAEHKIYSYNPGAMSTGTAGSESAVYYKPSRFPLKRTAVDNDNPEARLKTIKRDWYEDAKLPINCQTLCFAMLSKFYKL